MAFVANNRWPFDREIPDDYTLDVMPSLAAEIISPTNTTPEDISKVEEYFRFGAQAVWLVLPTVERLAILYLRSARRGPNP